MTTKLRILFSHYGIKDGDGFGRSYMLARELAARGHSVTIISSQKGGFVFPFERELRDNVELISFPDIVPKAVRRAGLAPLIVLLKCLYVLFKSFDIVHSDSGHRPSSGLPCVAHRLFRRSVYVSEWWDYFGRGGIQDDQPWWYRATLGTYDTWAEVHNKKIADGVVALSEFTRRRAMANGVREERILLLHGGSDTRTIQYVPDSRNRRKFGIPEDALVFGFVGINEHELVDLKPFLHSMNALKESKPVCWFSTGRKLSPETRRKYGLGEEYFEFGWVDYHLFSDLLSCADAFVMLLEDNVVNKSRWPQKIGDYLAAGRVLILNEVGEISMYTKEYPDAFVVVEWNSTEIMKSLEYMVEHKSDLMKRGRYSRKLAENEMSWASRASLLEEFYLKILGC